MRSAPKELRAKTITTEEQGNRLENLVHYVFSCAPDVFSPKGNWESDISEKDNIVEVFASDGGFMRDWPPYLVVECKNWSKPVGKNEVETFIGKVERANAHAGLMWSQQGITGKEWDAAEGLIKSALNKGIVVMVFTDETLECLLNGENFIDLLEQEYRARLFAL